MRPFIASLLFAVGCSAVPQAQPARTPQAQVTREEPARIACISNNPPFDDYYEETHASWAALQDFYVDLQSFERAYSAACRAQDLFEYIDAASHQRYQRLLHLEDAVYDRLQRAWIDHPEGPQRLDSRLRLYWEERAQGPYAIPLNPQLTENLQIAHDRLREKLDDYQDLRQQAQLEDVLLSAR